MSEETGADVVTYQRRTTDVQQEKIDELIAAEPDSKIRLMLMVMSNINKSIVANTDLTHAIHKEVKSLKIELDAHVETSAALTNQGLGAAKVMKVAGPVLWSLMAIAIGLMYHSYDYFETQTGLALNEVNVKLANIQTRLTSYGIGTSEPASITVVPPK